LLASCGRQPANVKTQFVDRDVPVQTSLDPRLLTDPTLPPIPAFKCLDKKQLATVCGDDMADYIQAYQKVGTDVAGQIKAIRDLQPKATP